MDSASPANGGSVASRTSRADGAANTAPAGRNFMAETGVPDTSAAGRRVPHHPLAPGDGRP